MEGVPGVDTVRASAELVGGLLEFASAPVLAPARWGANVVLVGLLRLLGGVSAADGTEPAVEVDGVDDVAGLPGALVARELLGGPGRYTRVQVAEQAGVSLEHARRLWRAVGFAEVDDERRVFTDADVAAVADVAELVSAGLVDPDGAVALARPVGQLLSRLAAAQIDLVSEALAEWSKDKATGEDDAADGTDGGAERTVGDAAVLTRQLLPVLERTTLYVWRRHLATEAGRALVRGIEHGSELGTGRAVGFVDISGFTRMSRELSATALGVLLERFETVASEVVVGLGGRVVKTLGDEVMFVCDSPEAAAQIALTLLEQSEHNEQLPPLHAGLAYGPVLLRGGDVFGPVVNVAARVAALARHGTVRTDRALADALAGTDGFELSARAPRRVRGYAALRSYRLRRSS